MLNFRRNPESKIIPFDHISARAFLGTITVLCCITCVLFLAMHTASIRIEQWQNTLNGQIVMYVKPSEKITYADLTQKIDRLQDQHKDQFTSKAVPPERTTELLQRWIGALEQEPSVLTPYMVYFSFTSSPTTLELEKFKGELEDLLGVPVIIDSHRVWSNKLQTLQHYVLFVHIILMILLGSGLISSIVFAIRSSLSSHTDIVNLLNLMGADHAYISRLFTKHFLYLSVKGMIYGVVYALISFVMLLYFCLVYVLGTSKGLVVQILSVGGNSALCIGLGAFLLVPILTVIVSQFSLRSLLKR